MRCVPPPTSTRDAVAPVVGADKLKDPPPTERIPPLATPPSRGLLTREEALSSERATPSAGVPPSVACIAAAWPADRRGSLRTLHPLTAPSAHAPQTDKHSTRASGRQPSPRPNAPEAATAVQAALSRGLQDSAPMRAAGRSAATERATPDTQGPASDRKRGQPGDDPPPGPRQRSKHPPRLSGEQPRASSTPTSRPGRVGARGRQLEAADAPSAHKPTCVSTPQPLSEREGAHAGARDKQPGERRSDTRQAHGTPYTQLDSQARASEPSRGELPPAGERRSTLDTRLVTDDSTEPDPRQEPGPKAPGARLASGECSP